MKFLDLFPIFESMGIEFGDLSASSCLGEPGGLEMDSQEIIELEAAVAKKFDVSLPRQSFLKETTLEQIENLINAICSTHS